MDVKIEVAHMRATLFLATSASQCEVCHAKLCAGRVCPFLSTHHGIPPQAFLHCAMLALHRYILFIYSTPRINRLVL